ncbi:MAG: DUF4156 domain-containing protein [Gammaproteobacteria bacterium]|nr:DUF4156 domain-containing protein [Gammaproteobacteria bacterium]
MKKILLTLVSLLVISCNWVEISEEGKAIRIVTMKEVSNCKRLGKIYAQSKSQIAGFDRNDKTIQRELEKLARNTAASSDMGGDTLVAISPIEKGRQSFAFYKCKRPALKNEGGE